MPKNLKLTIKSLKQSKLTGFSLLEMVITLLIATSLLLIGTLKLKSFQEELLFNSTIKEVATALEEGGRLSVIKRTEVDVACFPSGGITLYGDNVQENFRFDSRIKIDNLNGFHISKTGISAPRTLVFRDQDRRRKIKLQMAWGRINYE